ncbi:MAG: EAL domain-containing protein [Devosia sp.]|nr:EAL domain-containing protein [Devosia sp.]
MKGRGLNSIPIRFAVMTALTAALCVAAQIYLWVGIGHEEAASPLVAIIVVCAIAIPTTITWAAASKLTSQIRALRTSTEAIVAGDFDSPVSVDCACEVGGLADSFRKMVGRLNSNILRMNILAYSDALTGLPNRVVATHMLHHLTEPGNNGQGAILFIDLDGFKQVNDTHGHEAGDELLKQVSLRIIERGLGRSPEQLDACTTPYGELCERAPQDIVFVRFAGDEFVALLPDVTGLDALEAVATAILTSLNEPFIIGGNAVNISASIGIARTPIDSNNPAELLNFADIAMYSVKESGRNGFKFFDHSMRDLVVERNRIESDLRQALAGDELTLHYQPKLCAVTQELAGVEALARWHHPTRGMVSPGTFIPIAEKAGLMPVMGASILRTAIRQCRAWLDDGIRRKVAVNISPAQFEDPNLVPEILAMLREHQVEPDLLELEITESMLMSDFGATRDRVMQLQKAGITISIDDFGTGFSNLAQLAKLPFNAIKIDQSLIADIGKNGKSENIVKAIVDMTHALGHNTIAEGIETPEQLNFLQRIGCDQVQGFLLGRPMPAAELTGWEEARSQSPVTQMQQHIANALS